MIFDSVFFDHYNQRGKPPMPISNVRPPEPNQPTIGHSNAEALSCFSSALNHLHDAVCQYEKLTRLLQAGAEPPAPTAEDESHAVSSVREIVRGTPDQLHALATRIQESTSQLQDSLLS